MPCDTQRTVTLDLTVADRGVLLRALEACGLRAHVGYDLGRSADQIIATGEVRFTGAYMSEERALELAGQLKRAYAVEAVKTAAERYGYEWASSAEAPLHLELGQGGAF